MNQYATLLKALEIILQTKLWPEKTSREVLHILMYVHSKGWLYTPTIDGKVQAVICAYRIPAINDETLVKMPVKESGNILYVPFAISLVSDNLFKTVRASLDIYLKTNPDIKEIVLEDKNNKIKRFTVKEQHGEEQRAELTARSHI